VGRCLLAAAFVALPATGAGCNPGIDEGPATLVLLHSQPAAGAEGSPITGPVQMEFNESIDPRSITDSTFSLVNEGGHEVFGTLTVEGNRVRFDPELPLSLSERYRAMLGRDIRGSNGASLASAVEWSFSTVNGELASVQRIGTIDGHYRDFQMSVAIDDQARSWAVWLEDVATFSGQVIVPQPEALVVAQQSADRSSWQRSHRYEAPAVEVALNYSCLLWDRRHNGYLVWQERTADEDRIQLARFDAGKAVWEAPQTVTSSTTTRLEYPHCVLDAGGGLRIVWLETVPTDPAQNTIRQRMLDVEREQWLESLPSLSAESNPILAIVGVQRDGLATKLYFAINLSTVFLMVASLEAALPDVEPVAELSPAVEELKMSTNRSGACFFEWKDVSDASSTSLWALSRATDKDGWSSPHQIVDRPKTSQMGESQLSVDGAGDAFVSWREADGDGWKIYYASYQAASKRWDDPALFQHIGAPGYHASAITAAKRPMIIALSSQSANDSVWITEFQAPTGPWSKPVELSQHSSGTVVFPSANIVSMPTDQLAGFWYERKRETRTVGGVVQQHFTLDLWGVLYQPDGS
jgi:hypothetical protein